jgi:hypothetical protein
LACAAWSIIAASATFVTIAAATTTAARPTTATRPTVAARPTATAAIAEVTTGQGRGRNNFRQDLAGHHGDR